jgi:benzil reductase ((S)-benzoin forming)
MSARNHKFALVTGTSSGIGLATVQQLLERGWTVAGVSRRAAPLEHPRYDHCRLDLADAVALAREIEGRFASVVGDVHLERVALVNNAANAGLLVPVQMLDPVAVSHMYAVNVVAPVWCMGFVARHCPAGVPLRIVNVSSAAAVQAFPGLAAYGSSKAALRMAGTVLAAEWQSTVSNAPTRSNAAILSYEPGTVDTPMQESARSQSAGDFPWVSMFRTMHTEGRLVPPARPAAEIVAFLESARQPAFAERRLA